MEIELTPNEGEMEKLKGSILTQGMHVEVFNCTGGCTPWRISAKTFQGIFNEPSEGLVMISTNLKKYKNKVKAQILDVFDTFSPS